MLAIWRHNTCKTTYGFDSTARPDRDLEECECGVTDADWTLEGYERDEYDADPLNQWEY